MVGWLLDRGPADLRGSTLRRLPVALSVVVAYHVEGALDGLRTAYARVRVDLRDLASAHEVTEVLSALEAQGALLVQASREVSMVRDHLLEHAPQEGRPAT